MRRASQEVVQEAEEVTAAGRAGVGVKAGAGAGAGAAAAGAAAAADISDSEEFWEQTPGLRGRTKIGL